MDNNELEKIFNECRVSPSEILSEDRKVEILLEKILHKREVINSLNARNKRLEHQVKDAGCSIVNAMGLDFELVNIKANKMQERVDKVIKYLRVSQVSPTVLIGAIDVLEGKE